MKLEARGRNKGWSAYHAPASSNPAVITRTGVTGEFISLDDLYINNISTVTGGLLTIKSGSTTLVSFQLPLTAALLMPFEFSGEGVTAADGEDMEIRVTCTGGQVAIWANGQ